MAKLGPLASRDSCAGEGGVLDRLITHFCLVLRLWLGAIEGVVGA